MKLDERFPNENISISYYKPSFNRTIFMIYDEMNPAHAFTDYITNIWWYLRDSERKHTFGKDNGYTDLIFSPYSFYCIRPGSLWMCDMININIFSLFFGTFNY